jgi:hypothetical protein
MGSHWIRVDFKSLPDIPVKEEQTETQKEDKGQIRVMLSQAKERHEPQGKILPRDFRTCTAQPMS